MSDNSGMLTIYHLKGQHFNAKDRFDMKPVFAKSDIDRRYSYLTEKQLQMIADYDNATYYNDSIVNRIIKYWRDKPTILLYFSDHGEDMWDLGELKTRNNHRPNDPAWLDRQYHVPFIVWMSDTFKSEYPEVYNKIKNSTERPGTLDDIGHLILGLGNVDTYYYDPQRDLLNNNYKPIKRKTEGGYLF